MIGRYQLTANIKSLVDMQPGTENGGNIYSYTVGCARMPAMYGSGVLTTDHEKDALDYLALPARNLSMLGALAAVSAIDYGVRRFEMPLVVVSLVDEDDPGSEILARHLEDLSFTYFDRSWSRLSADLLDGIAALGVHPVAV